MTHWPFSPHLQLFRSGPFASANSKISNLQAQRIRPLSYLGPLLTQFLLSVLKRVPSCFSTARQTERSPASPNTVKRSQSVAGTKRVTSSLVQKIVSSLSVTTRATPCTSPSSLRAISRTSRGVPTRILRSPKRFAPVSAVLNLSSISSLRLKTTLCSTSPQTTERLSKWSGAAKTRS